MESYTIKDWLELFSYAATIIGIPLAIYVYYSDKLKDRKLKEKEALFTGHSLYADYLKLCLDNPDLQVYSTTLNKKDITPDEKKELIIFEILFTYLESAYLYYKDQPAEIKKNRWEGWLNYIREFSEDDTFRKAWKMTDGQWDKDFMKLINDIIRRN